MDKKKTQVQLQKEYFKLKTIEEKLEFYKGHPSLFHQSTFKTVYPNILFPNGTLTQNVRIGTNSWLGDSSLSTNSFYPPYIVSYQITNFNGWNTGIFGVGITFSSYTNNNFGPTFGGAGWGDMYMIEYIITTPISMNYNSTVNNVAFNAGGISITALTTNNIITFKEDKLGNLSFIITDALGNSVSGDPSNFTTISNNISWTNSLNPRCILLASFNVNVSPTIVIVNTPQNLINTLAA